MKRLKFISMMMVALAAVCLTFTSCNDDDDDNRGLSQGEINNAFQTVRGSYSGKLIYPDVKAIGTNTNDVADTTNISWSIRTDSTMTVHNFPVSLIAGFVTDSTAKAALATAAPQDMNCYIGFTSESPVVFLINPVSPKMTLSYKGGQHTFQIAFYVNSYYSFGQLSNNGSQLMMQILAAGLFIDGKNSGFISQNNPIQLVFLANR